MFSNNLITLRKMKKMSQEEIADIVGVSRQTISKWETGEALPDIEKGKKLAEIFDVSMDELMSFDSSELGMLIPPKGKHMFGLVKVGDKGQIVIPARARKIFNISAGDSLIVLGDESSGLAIMKADDFLVFAEKIKKESGL